MGHALGLEHEHQSPALKDCGWNYDWIFAIYAWSSQQQMHDNLDKLQNAILGGGVPEYQYSAYDGGSIMHYFFPADAFTDGIHDNCFIQEQADGPDAKDHQGVTRMGQIALTITPQQSRQAVASLQKQGDNGNASGALAHHAMVPAANVGRDFMRILRRRRSS